MRACFVLHCFFDGFEEAHTAEVITSVRSDLVTKGESDVGNPKVPEMMRRLKAKSIVARGSRKSPS